MNILYIIEEFVLGGAERVLIAQARALDRKRFNVTVCCLRRKGDFAYLLDDAGIPIIELGKKRGLDFSIISKVVRVIRERDIDLVHTHLWVANFWGRVAAILAGVPVVVTEHNVDEWKPWYYRWADRLLALFTKRVCVVSGQVRDFYERRVGLNPRRLELVYNGIDVSAATGEIVDAGDLRAELNCRDSLPVIVTAGRLAQAKAQDVFIQALKLLEGRGHEFHGLIIGDGPRRQELEALIRAQGLQDKILLTGMRRDVSKILALADVLVLSSDREGLPIILLEAMAAGLPCVATDVGGCREAIEDGRTGYLVPPRDPGQLADKIEALLKDDNLARAMGEAGRGRARENFSLERMMEKMTSIYLQAAAREGRGPKGQP